MEKNIRICVERPRAHTLGMNTVKTKTMAISKKEKGITISVGNIHIEQVNNCIYLATTINSEENIDNEINKKTKIENQSG